MSEIGISKQQEKILNITNKRSNIDKAKLVRIAIKNIDFPNMKTNLIKREARLLKKKR